MRYQKQVISAALLGLLGLGAASLAIAMPGVAACALVSVANLQPLQDGTLVDSDTSQQDREQVHALVTQARERIQTTFGAPRATPTLVFFQHSKTFWHLALNSYGSTNFIGPRACVLVGPDGRNTDVVAHELMHAELADRVGHWRRFVEIPAWFDEGVAMQVDRRPHYAIPSGSQIDTRYVRQLLSAHSFFQASGDPLIRNYASAKVEVARWLARTGHENLYSRFEQISDGEKFEAVLQK